MKSIEQQIAEMQQQLDILKAQLRETPKQEKIAAMIPEMEECEEGWAIHAYLDRDVLESSKYNDDNNIFPTEEMAEGYAKAFHMLVMLRKQLGSGMTDEDGAGWFVDVYNDNLRLDVCYVDESPEAFSLVPPFPTDELLRNAIEAVGGEQAVIEVMKFLANVKE